MMTLGQKQEAFAEALGKLLAWVQLQPGYAVRIGEVFRPKTTARYYASIGKGIINSAHCNKLAVDLFLSVDGRVTWEREHYVYFGEYWKELHPLARWGGDFKNRDAVHFSFEHRGVR